MPDSLGIPVIAFGLKTDFRNELFEGSRVYLNWLMLSMN
nr:hypothetical protein [Jeotgalicoccus sp. WY2]